MLWRSRVNKWPRLLDSRFTVLSVFLALAACASFHCILNIRILNNSIKNLAETTLFSCLFFAPTLAPQLRLCN